MIIGKVFYRIFAFELCASNVIIFLFGFWRVINVRMWVVLLPLTCLMHLQTYFCMFILIILCKTPLFVNFGSKTTFMEKRNFHPTQVNENNFCKSKSCKFWVDSDLGNIDPTCRAHHDLWKSIPELGCITAAMESFWPVQHGGIDGLWPIGTFP